MSRARVEEMARSVGPWEPVYYRESGWHKLNDVYTFMLGAGQTCNTNNYPTGLTRDRRLQLAHFHQPSRSACRLKSLEFHHPLMVESRWGREPVFHLFFARGSDLRRLLSNKHFHPPALQQLRRATRRRRRTSVGSVAASHGAPSAGFFTATSNSVFGPMASAQHGLLEDRQCRRRGFVSVTRPSVLPRISGKHYVRISRTRISRSLAGPAFP